MTLKIRFSIIGLGIILFLIATPLLVLYARGFKFNWRTHQVVKTGAMVIKTEPTKATVFLNGKPQKDLTPSNVRFLVPADYDIRIEKDGYQSWTKRLSVRAQLVSWANHNRDFITLFLKSPKLEQSWEATFVGLSQSTEEIIFVDDKQQTASINTSSGTVTDLGNISGIKFPKISSTVKVSWENATQIFELLQSKNTWDLTDKQAAQIQQASSNGAHTVVKLNSDLYSLDGPSPSLVDHNVLMFTQDGANIWYIQENFLKRFNYSTGNSEVISQKVPIAQKGNIIRSDNQVYAILDKKLYVLNDTFEKIYDNVNEAFWDPVSKLLLFTNDNELLIYYPEGKNTELILRNSGPLKNPILNSEIGYVFFSNEDKIKAVELDGRDHRNTYTITDSPDSFILSPDGKTLYTIGSDKITRYTIR